MAWVKTKRELWVIEGRFGPTDYWWPAPKAYKRRADALIAKDQRVAEGPQWQWRVVRYTPGRKAGK